MVMLQVSNETIKIRKVLEKLERTHDLTEWIVQDVTLEGNEDDMLALCKFVRGHGTLQVVSLRNIRIADGNVDLSLLISTLLVAVYRLQRLLIQNCVFRVSAVTCIQYCTTLEELLLPCNNLTDQDAFAIAEALRKSPWLAKIDLQQNKLSDQGCRAILQVIQPNKQTQTAILDHNGERTIDSKGIHANLSTTLAKAA